MTHSVWEGSQVVAEHDGTTGAVIGDYVYSGSRMVTKVSGGTTQYFVSDRLSARLVLDTSGNVLGRESHLPFGEDFGESGTQEKHHFTSYERDSEAGSDYAVNRQYSQGIGRFNSADPYEGRASAPQTLNRYVYVRSNPTNSVDPLGLELGLICDGYTILEPPNGDPVYVYYGCVPLGSQSGLRFSLQRIPMIVPIMKEKLSKKALEQFVSFLDGEKNEKCKNKLNLLGNARGLFFDQIRSGAGDVGFIDVGADKIGRLGSRLLFPQVDFNGTVTQLFAPGALGGVTLGVQTNSPYQAKNGPPGIYTIGGVNGSYFTGDFGWQNLEHEMAHYFTGMSDEGMVNFFKIPRLNNPKTGQPYTDSELVAAWFQGGCP